MKCAFCNNNAIGVKGYETGYIFLCIYHWDMDDEDICNKLKVKNGNRNPEPK